MKTFVLFTVIFVGFAAAATTESTDDVNSAVISNRRPRRCRTGFELNVEGQCVDEVTKCLRGQQLVDGTCTTNPSNARKQRKTDGSDGDAHSRSRDNLETPPDSLRDARPRVETRSDIPGRTVITETADPITQEEFGAVEVDVDTVCPIGHNLVGGKCMSIFKCPDGHERKNGVCVKTEIVCPNGFVRENSDCVPIPQCPKHHVWHNGRCVQDEPECASGFTWNGFQCIIVEKECPPGYIFKYDQCVKVRKVCAENEVERDNICHPLVVRCQSGYELIDGMCQKEVVRCQEGFVVRDGQCVKTAARCPDGFIWNGETCIRTRVSDRIDTPEPNTTTVAPVTLPSVDLTQEPNVTTTTIASVTLPRIDTSPPDALRRRRQRCPEGYRLYQGMCYRCKDDSVWCDNGCYRGSSCGDVGQGQNININIHSDPGRSSGGGGHNIINNIEPAENHIFNVNNVTQPVTLNNVNENHIFVYGNERCSDGTRQTKVIVNGQEMHGCKNEKPEKKNPKPKPKQPENLEKCCEIFTPRQCRKRADETWGCYHRRYNKCGGLCVADQVYLRPKETTWYRGVLTIAPSNRTETPTCEGDDCQTSKIFPSELIKIMILFVF